MFVKIKSLTNDDKEKNSHHKYFFFWGQFFSLVGAFLIILGLDIVLLGKRTNNFVTGNGNDSNDFNDI